MVGKRRVYHTCHYDLQHANKGTSLTGVDGWLPMLLHRPWGAERAECEHAAKKQGPGLSSLQSWLWARFYVPILLSASCFSQMNNYQNHLFTRHPHQCLAWPGT